MQPLGDDWHIADALHVMLSVIDAQLASHVPVLLFHWQSANVAHAVLESARRRQFSAQLLPDIWHMRSDVHCCTLMALDGLTVT